VEEKVKTRPPRITRAKRSYLSGAAQRVFIGIANAWSLSDSEQIDILALDSIDALEALRRPPTAPLPRDVLIRISDVLKIYRALRVMFPNGENADRWVRRPNSNPIFGGKPALAQMTTRQLTDLVRVREYLEAQLSAH